MKFNPLERAAQFFLHLDNAGGTTEPEAAASRATPRQPQDGPDGDTVGRLKRIGDRLASNPATRLFRVANTTTVKLESTTSSAGTLANPTADSEFPRPLRKQPVNLDKAPVGDEIRIGPGGRVMGTSSVQRVTTQLVTRGDERAGVPGLKLFSPYVVREQLRRTRHRKLTAEARQWADNVALHVSRPTATVRELFPIPDNDDPRVQSQHNADFKRLIDRLTTPRPRPLHASEALPARVEPLPPGCALPVATALADASGGDLALANRILDRLQLPLDINAEEPDETRSDLEERTWQCAQQLAHVKTSALEGLLRLQFGEAAPDAERGVGQAARLIVYLQAGHMLRTLDEDLNAQPHSLNDRRAHDRNVNDLAARQAMQALTAARHLPPNPADAWDIGDCEPEEITSYRTWQMGFVENGPGSPLDKASKLLFEGCTDWVERGAKRQALVDRTQGTIAGAPPGQRLKIMRARAELAIKDTPVALLGKGTPYRSMDNMLGADVSFYDTTRGAYDRALIEVRSGVLAHSRDTLGEAATTGTMLARALNIERLGAWEKARPTVPYDAKPRELRIRRPQSYTISERKAGRMWDDARAHVEALSTREPNNAIARRTLAVFDDPQKRDAFVKEMRHGAPGDDAKNGFTLRALERWMTESGIDQYSPELAEPLHERIAQARLLTKQPGVAPLVEITAANIRKQQIKMTETNVYGTVYSFYDGGTVGVDTSLWASPKTPFKGLLSVGPIGVATLSNEVVYAAGSAYNGGQIQYGRRRRLTTSIGAQGFAGFAGKVGSRRGIAGLTGSATASAALSREETAVIRTQRGSAARLGRTPDPDDSRKHTREMITALWDAAALTAEGGSHEEFMHVWAERVAGNPRISLVMQTNGGTTLSTTPVTLGAAVRANIENEAPAPNRFGVFANGGATGLFVSGNRTEIGSQNNQVNSTSVQMNATVSAGAQFAPRAITAGDGTGEIKSVNPASKTVLSGSVDFARVGRTGLIYLSSDARGLMPESSLRDVMYTNPDDFVHNIRNNPSWQAAIGPARLQQFFEEILQESSGEFSFGERWVIKPDRLPALNHYITMCHIWRDKKDKAQNGRERRECDAKIAALELLLRAGLDDPSAWQPMGLYTFRTTSRSSSQGSKWGARASHDATWSGTNLTKWEPAAPPAPEEGAQSGETPANTTSSTVVSAGPGTGSQPDATA
ncbi:hypothetical protein [Paraburkholderia sediminicola]|uniref:hypothetical protein n=1 Tax=Paraburkholderia sediminicola TaxID=458836 RepID=UPI0038BAC28D